MSSTRSIIAPPPFAANALTVIPPTPVAGVSYRDTTAGPASSPDGWPYAERVNSAEWNQIMYQISSLVSIIDRKGVLGWSTDVDYTEPAIVFGSDGILYNWLQASGPTSGGAKDPAGGENSTFWKASITSIPASVDGIGGTVSNLRVSATGASASVSVTADSICLKNAAFEQKVLNSVSVSASVAVGVGANGVDAGVVAASTWYSVWVIYSASSGGVACLLSLSSTSPVMPATYTHRARVGWIFTDSTANKFPLATLQIGRVGVFRLIPGTNSASPRSIATGTTSSVYSSISITPYCPPTASAIYVRLHTSNANNVVGAVAPNGNYGALTAGTPPTFPTSFAPIALTTPTNASPYDMKQGRLTLESTNVFYLSNSGTVTLLAEGWEDNL